MQTLKMISYFKKTEYSENLKLQMQHGSHQHYQSITLLPLQQISFSGFSQSKMKLSVQVMFNCKFQSGNRLVSA